MTTLTTKALEKNHIGIAITEISCSSHIRHSFPNLSIQISRYKFYERFYFIYLGLYLILDNIKQ